MPKKESNSEKSGKGLYSEEECHDIMARICGKSKKYKNLSTYLKYFRDIFVLTAALGLKSKEELVPLPSNPKLRVRTVNEKDIKIEHDNILKAIAYWHKGFRENDNDCHKLLIDINKIRTIGEKYCFAGKNTIKDMVSTGLFESELILKLVNE